MPDPDHDGAPQDLPQEDGTDEAPEGAGSTGAGSAIRNPLWQRLWDIIVGDEQLDDLTRPAAERLVKEKPPGPPPRSLLRRATAADDSMGFALAWLRHADRVGGPRELRHALRNTAAHVAEQSVDDRLGDGAFQALLDTADSELIEELSELIRLPDAPKARGTSDAAVARPARPSELDASSARVVLYLHAVQNGRDLSAVARDLDDLFWAPANRGLMPRGRRAHVFGTGSDAALGAALNFGRQEVTELRGELADERLRTRGEAQRADDLERQLSDELRETERLREELRSRDHELDEARLQAGMAREEERETRAHVTSSSEQARSRLVGLLRRHSELLTEAGRALERERPIVPVAQERIAVMDREVARMLDELGGTT